MQSNGAFMLRASTMKLCEAGLVPAMLVHDGILFEFDHAEQIEQAREIMEAVSRQVCRGFTIHVDVDKTIKPGQNYKDGRKEAELLWDTVLDALGPGWWRKSA